MPLGVLPLNENNLDEILNKLLSYCPKKPSSLKKPSLKEAHLSDGTDEVIDRLYLLDTLIGGNQLICARAHASKRLWSSHNNRQYELKGVTPLAEDLQARMCLLNVCLPMAYCELYSSFYTQFLIYITWLCLYKQKSSMEKGTLYQLKNLLNCTSVKSDPGKIGKPVKIFYPSSCLQIHLLLLKQY